jgi:hypothetical protein
VMTSSLVRGRDFDVDVCLLRSGQRHVVGSGRSRWFKTRLQMNLNRAARSRLPKNFLRGSDRRRPTGRSSYVASRTLPGSCKVTRGLSTVVYLTLVQSAQWKRVAASVSHRLGIHTVAWIVAKGDLLDQYEAFSPFEPVQSAVIRVQIRV